MMNKEMIWNPNMNGGEVEIFEENMIDYEAIPAATKEEAEEIMREIRAEWDAREWMQMPDEDAEVLVHNLIL